MTQLMDQGAEKPQSSDFHSGEASAHDKEALNESHVVNGEDAFAQVNAMSDMAYNISTPTGKTLRCRSKYIGMHSNNLLFIESPVVTPQEFAVFFQRGFPIKACAISQKGEGARIYFKSKIEYVVQAGLNSIVIVSLPSATQVDYNLRSEARLEIALEGILEPEERKFLCEIRDISANGCQIVVSRTANEYKVGNHIELQILSDNSPVVQGVIKNKKRSNQYWKYGVQFEETCQETSIELVEKLRFDQSIHKYLL
ncbi:flagellar brake protein [Vibrio sp. S4M6]|uniref:PilZ domain-containing protein n=1 Tax=Vibrio sinus TaxID=2946865 RepID=UPI00202A7778|nr:PilZ domain-containing protein [Vibrio sinus]MCL9780175.1 flagellar brake protein [Vibrio sinus]